MGISADSDWDWEVAAKIGVWGEGEGADDGDKVEGLWQLFELGDRSKLMSLLATQYISIPAQTQKEKPDGQHLRNSLLWCPVVSSSRQRGVASMWHPSYTSPLPLTSVGQVHCPCPNLWDLTATTLKREKRTVPIPNIPSYHLFLWSHKYLLCESSTPLSHSPPTAAHVCPRPLP